MADRILVDQVVRFAFVIRLASLLLVLLVPTDESTRMVSLVAIVFITVTSGLGLLATPLFTTTARTFPVSTASLLTRSGAAFTTFVVTTTAAAPPASCENKRPRSRRPSYRTPHAPPAARNPVAAVAPVFSIPISEFLFTIGLHCRTRAREGQPFYAKT